MPAFCSPSPGGGVFGKSFTPAIFLSGDGRIRQHTVFGPGITYESIRQLQQATTAASLPHQRERPLKGSMDQLNIIDDGSPQERTQILRHCGYFILLESRGKQKNGLGFFDFARSENMNKLAVSDFRDRGEQASTGLTSQTPAMSQG